MTQRNLVLVGLWGLLLVPALVRAQATADEAMAEARAGRVEAALAAIDAVLAQDPQHAEADLMRGVILAEAGRVEEAARIFESLIERHPDLPEAYNNLAVIQAANGDFDAAVTTLKDALATSASYKTTYENLTRIFAQLASEAYSRALEVESPPTRAEVELVMLSDLGTRPAPPIMAGGTPPQEASAVASPAPSDEAPEPTATIASEDLGLDEMEEPAAEEPATTIATQDLAGVVEAWAEAWSEQRIEDYLSFYAPEFLPANGMTREAWAASRRERIAKPEYIRIDIAILDTEPESDDRAAVTFLQAYESDTYSDQVTKTLALVKREDGWKIIGETVGS